MPLRVLVPIQIGLCLMSAVTAGIASAAPSSTCGADLKSWTGDRDLAVYAGTTGNSVDPELIKHHIKFENHSLTDLTKSPDGHRLWTLEGRYDSSSVRSKVFRIVAKDSDGDTWRLELMNPECDRAGSVTSARMEINNARQVGQLRRTH
ncbi:hypothetical protein [Nocardia goodfellowii]|uniref:Secreted protein n=1 Tax=Nocardia goodfellowii TaxID=882446 RepID=A0ABS4QQD1_9NOCA|nr:hypothetical protein [Nocardia goodfellowii]MBP2193239.1 hypothetical protein [Nocardia goodfellowii]